ncbi:MAG: hypothetical protein U0704_04800 [Candidatus Eisenbacteria bacterium]
MSDAELLAYLRMALAALASDRLRECANEADADVAVVDAHASGASGSGRPVLLVGGREAPAGAAHAPGVAHLRSPFNAGELLDALRALLG